MYSHRQQHVLVCLLCCLMHRIKANILITATPAATVSKGTSLQVICYVHSEITPSSGRCQVTWSRTYFPGREWREENIEGATLDQPRYYTTSDSNGQPISSSVHIAHMKELYRGAYKCTLNCDHYTTSATVNIDIVSVPVTFGATVGTLSAFLVLSMILLLAFFIGCRHCFCKRSQDQNALSNSSESLLRQSEDDMAPPRYSVVMSPEGSTVGSVTADENVPSLNGIVLFGPPSYEDAVRDLRAKGIIINTNKLKPMPPAYCEIPFINSGSESLRIHRIEEDRNAGSPT